MPAGDKRKTAGPESKVAEDEAARLNTPDF